MPGPRPARGRGVSAHAVLDAREHRDLRVRAGRSAALGDDVMWSVLTPAEFRQAQGDYPILFRRDREAGTFTPLALFGFETHENLFLRDGHWDASYVPLAMAIQPFLIGRVAPGEEGTQVHVDLASPRIARNGDGIALFDGAGQPTPFLSAAAERLGLLDEAHRATRPFVDALVAHELLEPTTAEMTLEDGSVNRLVGFHAIDEGRLRALDAAALGALHAADHLLPAFMAVASVGRLRGLIGRKNDRVMGRG